MKRMIGAIAAATVLLGVAVAGEADQKVDTPVPQVRLTDATSSPQELIDAFLHALETKNLDGLHRLRVTEAEFKDIILPGFVPPGEQPRTYPDYYTDYAWQRIDSRCYYYERFLLAQFGGHHYTVKDARYAKGTREYATYRTLKQLRLTLDADGKEVHLGTGSIVEVSGRYKFASFVYEN